MDSCILIPRIYSGWLFFVFGYTIPPPRCGIPFAGAEVSLHEADLSEAARGAEHVLRQIQLSLSPKL